MAEVVTSCAAPMTSYDVIGTSFPVCPLDVITEFCPLQSEFRSFMHSHVEQRSVVEMNVSGRHDPVFETLLGSRVHQQYK